MISLLFFFPICLIPCFSLEFKGKVITPEGKPIAEALVLHRLTGNKSVTDSQGLFVLSVPKAEKVRLEIIHPDYMDQEVSFSSQQVLKSVTIILIPYIRQKEEIVVTALRYPEPSLSVPAAETIVSAEMLAEKIIPNIADGVIDLPGVSNLGTGGFSIVPSIRGLARNRVLLLIDNARLASDRRTGPNASFIAPEDIEKIEVLRSPSSVFYGSDAIGGVIHILTKKTSLEQGRRGKINLHYGTVNQEKGFGFSFQGKRNTSGFYLSFQGVDAENYSSPLGEVLQSQFSQGSLFGKISHQAEKREIYLSFLGARGTHIGKPNRGSQTKPTWYPRENQNLIQFHWLEKKVWGGGDLSFQVYLNPNDLETKTEQIEGYKSKESSSKTQSTEYGIQLSYGKKFGQSFWLNMGTDHFGREGAKAINSDKYFGPLGNITRTFEETPYTKGKRRDLGLFVSADYSGLESLDLLAGLRWDSLTMESNPGGNALLPSKSSRQAWTGFLASSLKLSEKIVAFANISRAYRTPTLSELFYTGITGRGFIIANPDLKPETSLNLDAGLKLISRRFFIGLYSFDYEIEDMIERYKVSEKIYANGNIEKGEIKGIELEFEYYPLPGWKIFGNACSIKGKSQQTKMPLNDIPPARIFAGTRVWLGRFSAEVEASYQQKKDNPGPAEIAIADTEIVNCKLSYRLDSSLNFYFVLDNLFNKAYLARPDPESMEEPGRNFVLGFSYSF